MTKCSLNVCNVNASSIFEDRFYFRNIWKVFMAISLYYCDLYKHVDAQNWDTYSVRLLQINAILKLSLVTEKII